MAYFARVINTDVEMMVELKVHQLVDNFSDLIFNLDCLNIRKNMESTIWAFEA